MYEYTCNNWSHQNSNIMFKVNIGSLPGKQSTDSLQKTALLGTLHIIRKVLRCLENMYTSYELQLCAQLSLVLRL
jgi:hypothetical protein